MIHSKTSEHSFHANISPILNRKIAPDVFSATSLNHPGDDFVVSRSRDGSPLSYYGDNSWDWGTYCQVGRTRNLNFAAWCGGAPNCRQKVYVAEMKQYMFAVIWLRRGAPLTFGSLIKVIALVSKLAQFAYRQSLSIGDILSNHQRVLEFIRSESDYYAGELCRLLVTLENLPSTTTLHLLLDRKLLGELRRFSLQKRAETKQTPPIPTQIFTYILSAIQREIDQFLGVRKAVFDVAERCATDPFCGRSVAEQRKSFRKMYQRNNSVELDLRQTFSELLEEYGLTNYFEQQKIAKNVKGLSRHLTEVQLLAALQIHAYSGMRRQEVQTLPIDAESSISAHGRRHPVINGTTSKLSNGVPTDATWVTSKEGVQAIRLAASIAKLVYNVNDIDPGRNDSQEEKLLLFVSLGHLGLAFKRQTLPDGEFTPGALAAAWKRPFLEKITPRITEQDLDELEQVDPHRNWRDEVDFKPGEHWPLRTHQFRRSLALYATGSGLVSLPSLRWQLQHLTEGLTFYYSSGSQLATQLLAIPQHFANEYINTQHESAALSYIANVLLSEEKLFGAHAIWLTNSEAAEDSGDSADSRSTTFDLVRKGELSYRETVLGGCTQTMPCHQRAYRSVVACIQCPQAVIRPSRLQRLIAAQSRMLESLDPSSPLAQAERCDLEGLLLLKDKIDSERR